MRLRIKPTCGPADYKPATQAGFTFAEVLAALVFMAIVIPVTMQGIQIANRAGAVAERKSEAVRVADALLNDLVVNGNWQTSSRSGVLGRKRVFQWHLFNEPWTEGPLRLLTVEVTYLVQNQEYQVRLSTLVNETASP
jgi:type II secretory pathway pseudopilin PulG